MNIPYRPLALGLVALAFSAIVLQRAQAGGDRLLPPGNRPAGQGGMRQLPHGLRPLDAPGQFVETHDGQSERPLRRRRQRRCGYRRQNFQLSRHQCSRYGRQALQQQTATRRRTEQRPPAHYRVAEMGQ